MSWFKKFFGYRTQRAPSGSLPPIALMSIAEGLHFNVSASHGADWEPATVTNTNSMLPLFDSNAVVLLEKCEYGSLREGDLVTYFGNPKIWGGGKLILHRLNEKLSGGWWPLGDGNTRLDPELVTPDNFHRRVCGILYGSKAADTDN